MLFFGECVEPGDDAAATIILKFILTSRCTFNIQRDRLVDGGLSVNPFGGRNASGRSLPAGLLELHATLKAL